MPVPIAFLVAIVLWLAAAWIANDAACASINMVEDQNWIIKIVETLLACFI